MLKAIWNAITKRKTTAVSPTNAADFLQLKFLHSVLSFDGEKFVRTEYRKCEATGLTWMWRFPIHAQTRG